MAAKTVKVKSGKKKPKRMAPIAKLGIFIILVFSVFFMYEIVQEVRVTVELYTRLAEVQEKLAEVQEENEYLTLQKEKLQDPDYVESYARGNYMLTKDGEQIFYLPENENK